MKINNYGMIQLINRLSSFKTYKLPQKISYAITYNLKKMQIFYKVYEEQLNGIYEAYKDFTVTDEEGNLVSSSNGIPVINESHKVDFDKELTDLLNIEIDIDIHPVKEDAFDYEDDKYDALSPQQIEMLMDILCPQGD